MKTRPEKRTKKCTKCGKRKPVIAFHKLFRAVDGRNWHCKLCHLQYAKEWNKASPTKRVRYNFTSNLNFRYGISADQFNDLLKKQKGVCAICGKREMRRRSKRLSVDHCHKSQKIRGLLCYRCNIGLGIFKDSPDLLRRAAKYVS